MTRLFALFLLTGFLAASFDAAGGCQAEDNDPATEQGHVSPQPAQAGRKAYIDPKTGKLTSARPATTKSPPAAAISSQQKARREVPMVTHADGEVSADVGDLFMSTLEAEIVDGKLVTCHKKSGQDDKH